MNVSCTNCGKRYVLSDDKVAGKASVKIRCKQCQSLISIDVASAAAAPQGSRPSGVISPVQSGAQPVQSRGSGAIAVAAVQQPARSPWEDEATRARPSLDLSAQWHAMIAGVQQGPFDVKALMGKVSSGEVTLRTYLWKAGMADWKRAADLPEVSTLFAGGNGSAAVSSPPSRPVTRTSQPVARRDVAVANEMPSPEVTKPRGGNVADPLPSSQLAQPMPAATRPSQITRAQPAPAAVQEPAPQPAPRPEPEPARAEQPLNDLFGDISQEQSLPSGTSGLNQAHSQPNEQPKSAEIDPFAALGDPDEKELPPPGEATKFFIAQAGVNKRNPPWKIALFVVSLVALPTAVLYLLSSFKVVELEVTRTTDDGQVVQESFFSAGGVSGLKDILTGDDKRKKAEAERREKERAERLALARAKQNPGNVTPTTDDEPKPKPTDPKLALSYADLEDPNKKTKTPRDREQGTGGTAVASAGLKDDVAAKVVADNLKAFNLCIENALRRNPNLQVGPITVVLTVGSSGSVKGAEIQPRQHEGSDWGACMMQAGKRIVFPASDGETQVEVPLKVGVGM